MRVGIHQAVEWQLWKLNGEFVEEESCVDIWVTFRLQRRHTNGVVV